MAECKKNVGRGVIAYPCVVDADHDGPCMANENGPSIHARKAWLAAVELEQLETIKPLEPNARSRPEPERRLPPHPNAEPLSNFQGVARTSATGLMEHVEEGIASQAPLSTVDTNAPGQGRTLRGSRPRTIWAGEPVEVHQKPEIAQLEGLVVGGSVDEWCSVCGLPDHSVRWKHSESLPYREPEEDLYREVVVTAPSVVITSPTKTRDGDQPLPEVNDGGFIQDLVIEDIEARKAVGISRYGTPLQAFNGRNVDQDLYEELLDAATYLRQRLEERQALNDTVANLARLLDGLNVPAEVWVYLDQLNAGTNG